jgi:hypothetical protein
MASLRALAVILGVCILPALAYARGTIDQQSSETNHVDLRDNGGSSAPDYPASANALYDFTTQKTFRIVPDLAGNARIDKAPAATYDTLCDEWGPTDNSDTEIGPITPCLKSHQVLSGYAVQAPNVRSAGTLAYTVTDSARGWTGTVRGYCGSQFDPASSPTAENPADLRITEHVVCSDENLDNESAYPHLKAADGEDLVIRPIAEYEATVTYHYVNSRLADVSSTFLVSFAYWELLRGDLSTGLYSVFRQ